MSLTDILHSVQHEISAVEEKSTNLQLSCREDWPTTAEQILGQLFQFQDAEKIWKEKWSTTRNRPFWKNVKTGEKTWHDPFARKRKQQQNKNDDESLSLGTTTSSPLPVVGDCGLATDIPTPSQNVIANNVINDSSLSNEIPVIPVPISTVISTIPAAYIQRSSPLGHILQLFLEPESSINSYVPQEMGESTDVGGINPSKYPIVTVVQLGKQFKAQHHVSWKDMYGHETTLLQFIESYPDVFEVDDDIDLINRTLTMVSLRRDVPGGYELIEEMAREVGIDEENENDAWEEEEEEEVDMSIYMPPEMREASHRSSCGSRVDYRGGGMSARVERSRSRSRDRGWDRDDRSMCWRSQSTCLDPPQTIVITSVITFFFW